MFQAGGFFSTLKKKATFFKKFRFYNDYTIFVGTYNMKMSKHIAVFISLFFIVDASGQGFYNRGVWKKHRVEWSGGLGAANFLGDLGGRDRVGSDFIYDLEPTKTNFAAQFNHLFYVSRKIGLRSNITYAKLSADDKLTKEPSRNNRNLNFQSHIWEASVVLEFQVKKERRGNIYNLRSSAGRRLGLKSSGVGIYGVAGIGVVRFNPKSRDENGEMTALKPLHTEGQGLTYNHPLLGVVEGPKQYSGVSVVLPIGGGVKIPINRDVGLKVELKYRFTFTDYIDDVSGVYFQNNVIAQNYGTTASYFADPAIIGHATHGPEDGDVQGTESFLAQTFAGQIRGDATDKDGYMIAMLSVYKKIYTAKRSRRRKTIRRVKASF